MPADDTRDRWQVHTKLGHVPEATKVISDAQHLFQGTAEEVRVTIANCELALSRGDVDGALAMLKAIPKDSPHYLRAKTAMADIYLRSRNDKRMFAQCYQELVDMHPDTQTFMMLGEAYMQVRCVWEGSWGGAQWATEGEHGRSEERATQKP
jgi:tetratricopeptide repeat protein 21B